MDAVSPERSLLMNKLNTLLSIAKAELERSQERVRKFVAHSEKLQLARPQNELEFVSWTPQGEDDAILTTYLKKELANVDRDAVSSLPAAMLLDVVTKAAVDKFVLDRWHVDVHTY